VWLVVGLISIALLIAMYKNINGKIFFNLNPYLSVLSSQL